MTCQPLATQTLPYFLRDMAPNQRTPITAVCTVKRPAMKAEARGLRPMAATSSILASVHAVETALLQVCENPLCTVEFPESGLKIEPRRYCSAQCRQQASLDSPGAVLF